MAWCQIVPWWIPQMGYQGPHCPIILPSMFLHTTEEGKKEADRFICCGHQHGLLGPDLKANIPTLQLVGYQTSQKEIQDIYHEVYLIRRLPGPLPCRPQWREEAIQNILSSLRSHLQRWGSPPCWRRTNAVLLQLPLAHLQPGIPIQVPWERKLTWWGPSRGQRGSPAGVGSCLHAGVKYWKTEPGSRECPTPIPLQPQ